MSRPGEFVLVVKVDHMYDDVQAFAQDLAHAVANKEDVSVHVAGENYYVQILTVAECIKAEA